MLLQECRQAMLLCKIHKSDFLYETLNKYYKNIKLTFENSLSMFLDIKLLDNNGIYETQVYRKETKIPTCFGVPASLNGIRET